MSTPAARPSTSSPAPILLRAEARELGDGNISFDLVCQKLLQVGVQQPALSAWLQLEVEWGPLVSPLPAPRAVTVFLIWSVWSLVLSQLSEGGFVS